MSLSVVSQEVIKIVKMIATKESIGEYYVQSIDEDIQGNWLCSEVLFLRLISTETKNSITFLIKKRRCTAQTEDGFASKCFLHELYFYNTIYPVLQKLEKEFYVEPIMNISKCFLSSNEPGNKYMALESLRCQGFKTYENEYLDKKHIEFIYKIYGMLHGTAYALKLKKEHTFNQIAKNCGNSFEQLIEDKNIQKSINEVLRDAGNILIANGSDHCLQAFKKYVDDGVKIFKNCGMYQGSYKTIVYGDSRKSNLFFKYNEYQSLVNMKIVDWHLIKAGSPAHDLCYILYTGGTKESFCCLDSIIKIYYKSLTDTLRGYGEDVANAYPFFALKEDWKYCSKFALITSLLMYKSKLLGDNNMHINSTEKNLVNIFCDLSSTFGSFTNRNLYNQKVKDLIYHLDDIGVL